MVEPQLPEDLQRGCGLAASRASCDQGVLGQAAHRECHEPARPRDMPDPDGRAGRLVGLGVAEMPAPDAESRHRPVHCYRQAERAARVAGVADDAEQPKLRVRRIRATPDLRPARQQPEIYGGKVPDQELAFLGAGRPPHLIGGHRAVPLQGVAPARVRRRYRRRHRFHDARRQPPGRRHLDTKRERLLAQAAGEITKRALRLHRERVRGEFLAAEIQAAFLLILPGQPPVEGSQAEQFLAKRSRHLHRQDRRGQHQRAGAGGQRRIDSRPVAIGPVERDSGEVVGDLGIGPRRQAEQLMAGDQHGIHGGAAG